MCGETKAVNSCALPVVVCVLERTGITGKTQCRNGVNHENTEDAKDLFSGGKNRDVFAAGYDILTI